MTRPGLEVVSGRSGGGFEEDDLTGRGLSFEGLPAGLTDDLTAVRPQPGSSGSTSEPTVSMNTEQRCETHNRIRRR